MTIHPRRAFAFLLLALGALLAFGNQVLAQTDPLPSWNEGAAKKAIVEFVQATTTQGSLKFLPPADHTRRRLRWVEAV
jgi:hypothetical protein